MLSLALLSLLLACPGRPEPTLLMRLKHQNESSALEMLIPAQGWQPVGAGGFRRALRTRGGGTQQSLSAWMMTGNSWFLFGWCCLPATALLVRYLGASFPLWSNQNSRQCSPAHSSNKKYLCCCLGGEHPPPPMEPHHAVPFESSLPAAMLGSSRLPQLKTSGVFQQ